MPGFSITCFPFQDRFSTCDVFKDMWTDWHRNLYVINRRVLQIWPPVNKYCYLNTWTAKVGNINSTLLYFVYRPILLSSLALWIKKLFYTFIDYGILKLSGIPGLLHLTPFWVYSSVLLLIFGKMHARRPVVIFSDSVRTFNY